MRAELEVALAILEEPSNGTDLKWARTNTTDLDLSGFAACMRIGAEDYAACEASEAPLDPKILRAAAAIVESFGEAEVEKSRMIRAAYEKHWGQGQMLIER